MSKGILTQFFGKHLFSLFPSYILISPIAIPLYHTHLLKYSHYHLILFVVTSQLHSSATCSGCILQCIEDTTKQCFKPGQALLKKDTCDMLHFYEHFV